MINMNYDDAVAYGVELYVASKGMDRGFIQNEIIPMLDQRIQAKVNEGTWDEEFVKLSQAIYVLSSASKSPDTLDALIDDTTETVVLHG